MNIHVLFNSFHEVQLGFSSFGCFECGLVFRELHVFPNRHSANLTVSLKELRRLRFFWLEIGSLLQMYSVDTTSTTWNDKKSSKSVSVAWKRTHIHIICLWLERWFFCFKKRQDSLLRYVADQISKKARI